MNTTAIPLPSTRWLAAILLVVVASLGFGLYLQHVEGLEPCPLCIVQRFAFIAVGVVALVGLVVSRSPVGARTSAALSALFALAGFGVALWHVYLIAYPPESMSCGRPFSWMLDNMPLATLIPKMFRGEADCLRVDWTLFGLSIPQWSLVLFTALFALAVLAWRGARRGGVRR